MTIVAASACPEGIAIAGDSRSTVQLSPSSVRTATDYTHKLFTIDDRFGAATFGWGILEGKTISGHVRDFDQQTTIAGDVGQAAIELRDYFNARLQAHISAGLDPAPPPGVEPLGFIIGGYDTADVGHVMQVWPYGGAIQDLCQTTNPGGVWNGEIDVMIRLVKGFDGARVNISRWAKRNKKALADAEYITNFGWFALQDAVDWTTYVARTTIDTQRFTNGTVGIPGAAPTTGGEIEVLTITPGDEVRWVRRTDLRG